MFGLLQTSVATSELIFVQLVGSFKSFKDLTHSHPILSFDNVQSVQVYIDMLMLYKICTLLLCVQEYLTLNE